MEIITVPQQLNEVFLKCYHEKREHGMRAHYTARIKDKNGDFIYILKNSHYTDDIKECLFDVKESMIN